MTPQVLGKWPVTNYARCFSKDHSNLRCSDLVVFELSAKMTIQMCFIGWGSSELDGQNFHWNSASCSWNDSNTNEALLNGAFTWGNKPFLAGKTGAMYGCNWCTMIVRYCVAFNVCATTNTGPRDAQENFPQTTIPPQPACVWPAVQWGSSYSPWKTVYPDTAIGEMND